MEGLSTLKVSSSYPFYFLQGKGGRDLSLHPFFGIPSLLVAQDGPWGHPGALACSGAAKDPAGAFSGTYQTHLTQAEKECPGLSS